MGPLSVSKAKSASSVLTVGHTAPCDITRTDGSPADGSRTDIIRADGTYADWRKRLGALF
jgi:hypothetical protein